MAEQKSGSGLQGSVAPATEPATDRHSVLPNSPDLNEEALDDDLQDISKILLGAQAISGKALSSSKRMSVNEDARHTVREQQRLKDEREARELANLARWNAQKTTVGGVEMTNEQAQEARQNVIDNDETYANWAVRKGLINEDEKDEFKSGIRRKKELEDKRGRGTLTAAEAAEETQLDRSRTGRALDAATAQNHLDKGHAPVASAQDARTAVSMASSIEGQRKTPFGAAPNVNDAFTAAAPPPQPVERQVAVATAPAVKATGLDL